MSGKTRLVEQRGLQAKEVAIVAVLLAVGAALRMFTPAFAGITPNFIIGMYCLALLLLRPKLSAVLGIGLVAAAVCMVTTKSLVPFLNFLSEPLGAVFVAGLASIKMKLGFLKYLRPGIITYLGTLVSGFSYAGALITFLTIGGQPAPAFAVLGGVVLVTALANAVLVNVLYFSLKSALNLEC